MKIWHSSWLAATAAVLLASAAANWQNDGLWFQGDSPRHALNGVLLLDFVRSGEIRDARSFALDYYAQYPAVAPTVWPPGFAVLEAFAYAVFGFSPLVAKGLVFAFGGLFAVYLMRWLTALELSPLAGWAALLVLAQPGFLVWLNAVMLDVPGLALGTAAAFHIDRARRGGRRQDLVAAGLFAVAAAWTRPAAVVLPVVFALVSVFSVGGRRLLRLDSCALATAGVLAFLPWIIVQAKLSGVVLQQAGSTLKPVFELSALTYYPRTLFAVVSPGYAALFALAVAASLALARARRDVGRYCACALGIVAVFSLMGEKGARYVVGILPMVALTIGTVVGGIPLAAALVPAEASERVGRWRVALAGTIAALLTGVHGAAVSAPAIRGIDTVVERMVERAPGERVLYLGRYDGVFVYYTRLLAGDVGGEPTVRTVRGSKVFFASALQPSYGLVELVERADDVVRVVSQYGTRWLLLEREDVIGVEPTAIARAAIRADPRFRFAEEYAIETPRHLNVSALELYEFLPELPEEAREEFVFPSLAP